MSQNDKSDVELMEAVQMLMAQVGQHVKELHRRGVSNYIVAYDDGSFTAQFTRTQDITPGKAKSK